MRNKGLTIAVSGKGGTGKTMLSSLLVGYFSKLGSVFAIDADPDSNLPEALGVDIKKDVGLVREEILDIRSDKTPPSMTKKDLFEMELLQIIEEGSDFDLLVMGRSEGAGCYCTINHILRDVIDTKAMNYDTVIIDCEAGLEHLSRRTTRGSDIMIVVTDATKKGILTAKRVKELSKEVNIEFDKIVVVANKVTSDTRPIMEELGKENDLDIIGYIPFDPIISQFDALGKSILELPQDSLCVLAAHEIFGRIKVWIEGKDKEMGG
ncbi:MAG: AAA family ATPase [Halobacteriota archaeon]|nr:AAA family ATPase [Halobacteriota archaeon]